MLRILGRHSQAGRTCSDRMCAHKPSAKIQIDSTATARTVVCQAKATNNMLMHCSAKLCLLVWNFQSTGRCQQPGCLSVTKMPLICLWTVDSLPELWIDVVPDVCRRFHVTERLRLVLGQAAHEITSDLKLLQAHCMRNSARTSALFCRGIHDEHDAGLPALAQLGRPFTTAACRTLALPDIVQRAHAHHLSCLNLRQWITIYAYIGPAQAPSVTAELELGLW
jgi:hypothetical protein